VKLGKRLFASPSARGLLGLLLRMYRNFMYGSFRFRHDPALHALLKSRTPVIYAMWHQDFVHTMGYLSRFNVRRPTYVLASESRDGEVAAEAAHAMGFRRSVRGSSARGGARALLELHRLAKTKHASIAVVCDGPRPPARDLKPGVLHLARETGLPLWLVRTAFRPVKVFDRSWPQFHMPMPGARGVSLTDGPIHVPADLDRAGLDRLRDEVEVRLNRLADRAEEAVTALASRGT
jgi:lysophospholipid acyltransferase (LPLAT)-like uncharacterized protein